MKEDKIFENISRQWCKGLLRSGQAGDFGLLPAHGTPYLDMRRTLPNHRTRPKLFKIGDRTFQLNLEHTQYSTEHFIFVALIAKHLGSNLNKRMYLADT